MNVGLLNSDNTTSVNREKIYLVLLFMSAAWQTIFEIVCLVQKYGKNGNVVHIKTSMFTTEGRENGYVVHIKISMFTTYRNREKTGMLYIFKIVCN